MGWSEAELRLIRQREGIAVPVVSLLKPITAPRPVGGPTVEDPEVWTDLIRSAPNPGELRLRLRLHGIGPRLAVHTPLAAGPMPVDLMMPLRECPPGLSYFWTVNAEWHMGLVTGTSAEYHDAVFTAMERDRTHGQDEEQ